MVYVPLTRGNQTAARRVALIGRGHTCIFYTRYKKLHNDLGILLTTIFTRAARDAARNNRCGPLSPPPKS